MPAAEGVPVRVVVGPLVRRAMPGGSAPAATVHAYVELPMLVNSVVLVPIPARTPEGMDVVTSRPDGFVTVRPYVMVKVCPAESWAVAIKPNAPVLVVVPEINPAAEELNPGGNMSVARPERA